MGGLGALIVIVIYVAVAITVVRALKNKKARYAAIAIFALAPTADAVIGRIYLGYRCTTEGGVKIYRSVSGVQGFLYDVPDKYWIERHGYSFSEGQASDSGNVNRYQLSGSQVVVEWNVPRKSAHRVRTVVTNDRSRYETIQNIVDVPETNEVLATYTQISFYGGWAERLLGSFADAGAGAVASCDQDLSAASKADLLVQMIKRTLQPQN